ncbi:MAG: hypothetical protein ACRD37_10250 [Candidatus Acidiferrales bacterium]
MDILRRILTVERVVLALAAAVTSASFKGPFNGYSAICHPGTLQGVLSL